MKTERMLIFFILVSFLLRLFLCLQPAAELIPKAVSDDMFYYLCIARNIAHGLGATADGVNVTNGFHPLWTFVLVPLSRFFGHAVLQSALVALTLFSVLSAWFIYRILRFSCNEAASFLGALVWLFCPYTVLVTLAGVEAPLFALVLSATAYYYLMMKSRAAAGGYPWKRLTVLGILAGAAALARIDGGVFAAILFLSLLVEQRVRAVFPRRIVEACVFACACGVVTLPWFLWSYLRTGFLFQTSGRAIYHQQHVIFWAQQKDAGPLRYAAAWISQVCANLSGAARSVTVLCGTIYVAAVIALVVVALSLMIVDSCKGRPSRRWLRVGASPAFLFCYGAVLLLLYCGYLWYSQDWYYYSIVFVGCIFLGCVFDLLDERLRRRCGPILRTSAIAAASVCIVVFSQWQTRALWGMGIRGWQIDMYRAALWVKGNIPPQSRIGSFNSGILSYYCPQTVINLDGVVNGAAYRAIQDGKIFSYAREQGIDYLVESPLSINFRMFQSPAAPPPAMKAIHSEGTYPEAAARGNPVTVYQIVR